jgi:acetate kinase
MSRDIDMPVLALNAGSSSLKFGLYLVGAQTNRLLVSGTAQTTGEQYGPICAKDADGNTLASQTQSSGSSTQVIVRIAQLLSAQHLPAPAAIGHRIVHGGAACRDHTLIDATVMLQLQAAKALAPLHVPPALSLVRSACERFPDIPQAACLDTTFHTGMPEVARTLPIPPELRAEGIQRYGFHGLSCESIVRQLGDDLPRRMVIAHLGSGASVTAVANGRSVDTSMGLTPSGGVIMGTRCGDIDPGVLAYVVRELHYDAAQLESLIDLHSGLLGISGASGNMHDLRAAAASNANARLAVAMFCYSVRKQIGAMAAVLGGVDLLVFTGGIGENDAASRATICDGLDALGIGTRPAPADDARKSRGVVRVVPSQEDEQIVRHTWRLANRCVPAADPLTT